MHTKWTLAASGVVLAVTGAAGAQAGASATGQQAGSIQANGTATRVHSVQDVQATLSKELDARDATVGQVVVAKTTADFLADGMKVSRGSRLVGHVTEAQARGKGNAESKLGVLFDRVEPRGGGQPIPVSLHIAGVNAPKPAFGADGAQADLDAGITAPGASASAGAGARTSGGGGLLGGVGNTVSGVTQGVGSATGAVTDTAGSALRTTGNAARSTVATAGSTLQGIAITTTGAAGSTLTSTTRNVQLQSGTSLMLTGTASAR